MSRKLLTEIDKTLKDARNTMDGYDGRWNELRNFNQTQVGVKEKVLEESRREQMRGKKHAVRTATLELLDFKHACDSKAKIESDMEAILRRLHRLRQQLTEWLGCGDLRTQFDELKDLKKQIELRYKRGRVFYCMGQSSEDASTTDNDQQDKNADYGWIEEFIAKLKLQAQAWEVEVTGLVKELTGKHPITANRNSLSDKKAQLEAFVDLHKMHIRRLTNILRAVRNYDYELPASTNEEICETLSSYLDGNRDLTVVVADEIYHDIDIPMYDSSEESAPDLAIDPQTAENPPLQSPEIVPETEILPVGQASEEDSTHADSSSADVITSSWSNEPAYMVIAEDVALCDWTYEGRGNKGDAITSNKTLKLRRGDKVLIIRIDPSGWTFGFIDDGRIATGVKSLSLDDTRSLRSGWFPDSVRDMKKKKSKAKTEDVWEIGAYSKPTKSLLERLQIVDSNYKTIVKQNATPDCLIPQDFLDVIETSSWWWKALATVTLGTVCIVRWSWTGEFLRDCKCEVSFLDTSDWGSEESICGSRHNIINVNAGDRVFVEADSPDHSWVFGKVLGGDCISGWFPGYVLVNVNDLLDRLVGQTNTLLDSSIV